MLATDAHETHTFSELETERKLTTIQAGILYLSGQLSTVLESNQSTQKEIGRLESLCNTNWEPSKEAKVMWDQVLPIRD